MRLPRRVMSLVALLVLALACAALPGPASGVFDGLVPRAEAGPGAGGSPTITGLPASVTLDEDTSRTLNFEVDDSGTAPRNLVVTAFRIPDHGTLVVGGQGKDRSVTYMPNANYNGSDTFRVRVTDSDGEQTTQRVDVTVNAVNDPPVIDDAQDDIIAEATGPNGASVPFTTPTATDPDTGDSVTVTCRIGETDITSPHDFPLGETTVDCTATDGAGGEDTTSFTVTVVDTTGPVTTFVGGPQPGQSYAPRALPAAPTCTAMDTVSGMVPCTVTGYGTEPGTYTLTARAQDAAGNETVETRDYTVTDRSRTEERPTRPARPTDVPRPARPARPAEVTPTEPVVTGAEVAPAATEAPTVTVELAVEPAEVPSTVTEETPVPAETPESTVTEETPVPAESIETPETPGV